MEPRLGIYIHIPFCASKCGYCDFYSCAGAADRMADYQHALLEHIEESAGRIAPAYIDTVYFGGGTPSFYGAARLIELLDAVKATGRLLKRAEVTVEVNPDSVRLHDLRALHKAGFNRLSIGMQSANNDILKMIGRRHSFHQVEMAVKNARIAGFDNVSLDLIYGLPSQTRSDWADTLAKAIALRPEHISGYGLKLEEGTPMYALKDSPLIPSDDEQADMYLCMVDELRRYGYEQYEISNFSIPGYESRHNLKYWQLDDYMGFGPGAHSCIGRTRYSYVRDLDRLHRGRPPRRGHDRRVRDHRRFRARGGVSHARHAHRARRVARGVCAAVPQRFFRHRAAARNVRPFAAGPSRTGSAGTSRRRAFSSRTCSSASSSRRRPSARPSTTRG